MGPGVELKLSVNVSVAFLNNPLHCILKFYFQMIVLKTQTFFLFQLLFFKLLIVDL